MKTGVMNEKSGHQGVTAVIVTILLIVFLGVAALAIDIGHLYVVRNELQNAADAGALAGSENLYIDGGTEINTGANQEGQDAAEANKSQKTAVEVNWTGGNGGDVQRGHWCFSDRTFSPNASIALVDLWNTSTEELDANPDFINAVKVTTRRQATPAASFFARIFGHENFSLSAEAVAYIGFAGTLEPGTADVPFAICKQSIVDASGNYTCVTGRMINSSSNSDHQSGGWTNFSQPCETANPPSVSPLVCGSGNPSPIFLGQGVGSTNGMDNPILVSLRVCWMSQSGLDTNGDGMPDKPWKVTLPVIDCGDGINVGNCNTVVGAVEVNVLWITPNGNDPGFNNVPVLMYNPNTNRYWSCTGSTGEERQACWNDFAATFNLRTVDNSLINTSSYLQKSIYLLPDCDPHVPSGRTGGENFGILAKIPVLVK